MKIEFENRAAEPLTVPPPLVLWALRQPKPAPKVATFGIHRLKICTDTVSESASESSRQQPKILAS
jgi:hypothetical protein